ncbi:MAG: polyphosphate:AMP phosphotransferase [Xanthomonadales bacterium]|nr:polyphosphate:AMP phosphotransferase [Xanthomonadales bacterium]
MFESADLDHVASKARWKSEAPKLRQRLLQAQWALGSKAKSSVLIIVGGVDGAGKGETVHLLNEWMDPRHIKTYAFSEPTDEETLRPDMWRYWRVLPPRGSIGVFYGSWYTAPIVRRVLGHDSDDALESALERIRRHEAMLAAEGVQLVKLWFHLSRDQQKKRLRALEKNPDTRWRVTDEDWRRFKKYDEFRAVSMRALRETSTGHAAWEVVPGMDHRYRSLCAAHLVLDGIERANEHGSPSAGAPASKPKKARRAADAPLKSTALLDDMNLAQKLGKKAYASQLERWQGKVNLASRSPRMRKRGMVVVFEGWDAAGKGSTIRRVTAALDARHYRIYPVAAPSEEERAQPYLWRFWRNVPRRGQIAIFDRSWYGRVLVERVEGFCAEADWMRAYSEINEFEAELADSGFVLAKFWLQISPEEQLRRFRERQETPFKQFKITDEDWRNRDKRAAYSVAVTEMVERCSTEYAPWTLVEAEDKHFARIKVLKTLHARMSGRR